MKIFDGNGGWTWQTYENGYCLGGVGTFSFYVKMRHECSVSMLLQKVWKTGSLRIPHFVSAFAKVISDVEWWSLNGISVSRTVP